MSGNDLPLFVCLSEGSFDFGKMVDYGKAWIKIANIYRQHSLCIRHLPSGVTHTLHPFFL
jgi:hypothetical protein